MRRLWRKVVTMSAAGAVAITGLAVAPGTVATAAGDFGAPDAVAANYYEPLLRHTRWAETKWDASAGAYQLTDFNFAVVLGNAVLLKNGEYDEEIAGISEAELQSQTLATITHYAASNRNVNASGTWGKRMFWDSTFQSYFLAAGKLMWDDLDAETQTNLSTIAAAQTAYTVGLNMGDDPMSGSWTARYPEGDYNGDTALEESGVYTQAISPGVAWATTDNQTWTDQLNVWVRNAAGLPIADKNNTASVAGVPIADNMMQNIRENHLVENHGSFGPHYQSDVWRSGGRNAIHFILNGKDIPEAMLTQPNSAELWRSIELVMSAQGEPFMPMVADREFLYGRDVIPLAYVAQVLRNPIAARAEENISEALMDYMLYTPTNRLTKFSGEPKYEPEARAEVAISYLLHVWNAEDTAEGPVTPADDATWFNQISGVRDFGNAAGITVQQSGNAWAGVVSRNGYVKFPWPPNHNAWTFQMSGNKEYLFPSSSPTVNDRNSTTYTDNGTVIGQVTLVDGYAELPLADLAVGDHSIVAKYSGDAKYSEATSAAATVKVNAKTPVTPAPVITGIALSRNKQVWNKAGGRIQVTARVANATSGTVVFRSGTQVLGTAQVAQAGKDYAATLTLARNLPVGKYAGITAALTVDGKTVTSVDKANFKVVKAKAKKPVIKTKAYKAGAKVKLKVTGLKLNNGQRAVGTLRVFVGKKRVKTVKLKGKAKKVTTTLKKRYTGSIKVRVKFVPKDKKNVKGAKSKVRVLKAR